MTSNLKSLSFANMSPEQVEAEYKRIKVGVKTLDDAVLQLGSLQKAFPRHGYTVLIGGIQISVSGFKYAFRSSGIGI